MVEVEVLCVCDVRRERSDGGDVGRTTSYTVENGPIKVIRGLTRGTKTDRKTSEQVCHQTSSGKLCCQSNKVRRRVLRGLRKRR